MSNLPAPPKNLAPHPVTGNVCCTNRNNHDSEQQPKGRVRFCIVCGSNLPNVTRTTRSSSNTRFVEGVGHVTDFAAAQAMWDDQDSYSKTVDAAGVVRWDSNGSVPPLDILEDWAELGLPFDLEASKAADAVEWEEFATRYRANQQAPSDEEMFEMRAAFGPGAVVVDCISGRKTQL